MKKITIKIFVFCLLFVLSKVISAQGLFTEHIVFNNYENAVSIAGADLDGDGDIDMVASSYNGHYVAWMENDGMQNFTKHIIIENFGNAFVLDIAHIDEDDDFDIVCAAKADDLILWFENDGLGNFTIDTVIANWESASFVMAKDHFNNLDLDIDGDGDTDILATSNSPGNKVSWFENDGNQNFTEHIVKEDWYWARYSTATDLDQDDDIDIIGTAKDGEIIWFVNDGLQNFTEDTVISSWGQPSSVQAADIDGDGDIDLAATSVTAQEVAWFENDNNNFTKHTIKLNYNGAFSVAISDFDDDGNLDIAAEAWIGSVASVFYNDGEQNFTEEVFCNTAYELIKIFVTDLDLDGDQDILGATAANNDVRWWENSLYTTSIEKFSKPTSENPYNLRTYPNPFVLDMKICYSLPSKKYVKLYISDIQGKLISNLVDSYQIEGSYSINWCGKTINGDFVDNGIDILWLEINNIIQSKQIIKIQK